MPLRLRCAHLSAWSCCVCVGAVVCSCECVRKCTCDAWGFVWTLNLLSPCCRPVPDGVFRGCRVFHALVHYLFAHTQRSVCIPPSATALILLSTHGLLCPPCADRNVQGGAGVCRPAVHSTCAGYCFWLPVSGKLLSVVCWHRCDCCCCGSMQLWRLGVYFTHTLCTVPAYPVATDWCPWHP